MDGQRFDQLTRTMGRGASRRGFLGTLAAGIAVLTGGSRPALAQCNLGSCTRNTDCTCPGVETCGNDGQCCRTQLGIYCNPNETGSHCCGPNYVCTTPGVFPPPTGGGCQCNTAEGFTQDPTTGACCIANGTAGNANHPDLCCSGCVCADGTCCACQQQCSAPGQACNACHACCAGSTCTKPNAPCTGPQDAGVCVANQECVPVGGNCNINHPCCHPDQFHCSSTTTETGTCVASTNCTGVLCPADPRGQRKCCPAGHTCNPNKNGTYNCGKGKGVRGRHRRGRHRR